MGARAAHRYFLTAERFDAAEALRIGFVHAVVPVAQLDEQVAQITQALVNASPNAVKECKTLLHEVAGKAIDAALIAHTVQGIAGIRWRNDGRYFEVYEWIVDRQDRLSARDIDDPRIPPGGTPGYHTLNLRAGRRWGNNSNLALGLENILDRHYRVHGSGIDAPGITFTLGYELFY